MTDDSIEDAPPPRRRKSTAAPAGQAGEKTATPRTTAKKQARKAERKVERAATRRRAPAATAPGDTAPENAATIQPPARAKDQSPDQLKVTTAPDSIDPEAKAGPADPSPMAFMAGPIDLPPPERQRIFSRLTRATFFLMVVLPILVSAAYFNRLAADRYAVDMQFAIRSPSGLQGADLIGMVTGGTSSGSPQSDSYMVVAYLESRPFLDELSAKLDLKAIYAIGRDDPLTRLAQDATKEDQVNYLPAVIRPHFDANSQIVTVEVLAFTPEDAYRVAEAVLQSASAMVNRVSEQARQDTVRLAEAELARVEAALRDQRAIIARFRDSAQQIDPNRSAAAQEGVLAGLLRERADTRAQMTALREFLSPDAPSIRVLQSRIASIESQIDAERARLGSGGDTSVPSLPETGAGAGGGPGTGANSANISSDITRYEELAVDLDFLQRSYLSALASLESARIEADRQQRYVATFVHPAMPEDARYPRVFLSMALIAATCFLIWSILTMLVHVVREHLR